MSLSDFPPELLAKIFSYLPDSDICDASLTCRAFQQAVNIDLIWQKKCHTVLSRYLLENVTANEFSSFEIYTKLLKKYGFLIGTWQPQRDCYGGLISVKYDGHILTATEYKPPCSPHVTDPLRESVLFTVTLMSGLNVEVLCHQGYSSPHPCTVTEREDGSFHFKCEERKKHEHPEGEEEALQQFLWEELDTHEEQLALDAFVNIELLQEKYQTLSQFSCDFSCLRISIPKRKKDVVIQPGLFKGVYGSHGIEIVSLDYDDKNNKVLVTKITGDPNVFASKISIKADYTRPMVLTCEQQQSIATLKQIDIPDIQPDVKLSGLPQQPFQVPNDCFERGSEAPRQCISRFHASGQIAGHLFSSPSYIPSHWVVFDEDCFGNVWLDLRSFSIFYRIKQNFL